MTKTRDCWAIVSSVFYALGGALFIVGSIFVIPGMTNCTGDNCTFNVALWYLIGCIFYFFAAIIDLVLQLVVWNKQGATVERRYGFRFDAVSESLFAAFVYFIGSILFLVGSIFFFPVLNATQTARLVFRSGSCVYIFGSAYGTLQLLAPNGCECEGSYHGVRRRTMTQVETIIPFSGLAPISDSDPERDGITTREKNENSNCSLLRYVNCSYRSLVVGLIVKLSFICGSTCFLSGGFLLQAQRVTEGGYLWFIGSIFFLLGSLVSLLGIYCDRTQVSSASSVSSGGTRSSESDRIEQGVWAATVHDIGG